VRKLP